MNEQWKEILSLAADLCQNGAEVDAAEIAMKCKNLQIHEVITIIGKMEQMDLLEVIEIDMCCGVDYIITSVTQKGRDML